ncbi:hypothetical protein LMH73_022945 [Vibrio splendidus]|nr:hypothetical protein [Vibrio splendidus]MCC4883207.1 hypothetical protein [Vibrio splendidus]
MYNKSHKVAYQSNNGEVIMLLTNMSQNLAPAAIISSGLTALIIDADRKNASVGYDREIFHYVSTDQIKMIQAHKKTLSQVEKANPNTPMIQGQSIMHNDMVMAIAYLNSELDQVMLLPHEQFHML